MAEDLPQLTAGEAPPEPAPDPPPAKPKAKKRKRRRAKADTPPRPEKSGAAKRGEKKAGEIARIEKFFTKLFTLPAGAFMVKGDTWAFEHVVTQGPELGKAIADECSENETMRRYCLQLVEWFSVVTLAGAVGAYALPLLMHFGIIPGAQLFGVPVIATKPKAAPGPAGNGQAPPPFMGGRPAPPAPEPEPTPTEPTYTGDPLADELSGAVPPPPVESI